MDDLLHPTIMGVPDMAPSLNARVNTSLVDIITQMIRKNIYTGKYEEGKKLIVRELAEEFGVSHTPIKDALNRLVAEGYVEAPPRRSMVVRSFSNVNVIDMLQARLMCEVFCSGQIILAAAEHPEIAVEMRRIMGNISSTLLSGERPEYEEWVQSEIGFHSCYMKHCGNNQIYKFYLSMDNNRTTYFSYLATNRTPVKKISIKQALEEHLEIVEAIEALDKKRFSKAVLNHIFRVASDYATDEMCHEKLTAWDIY